VILSNAWLFLLTTSTGGATFPALCNFFRRRTSHHSTAPAAIAQRKLTVIHNPVTHGGRVNRFMAHIVTANYTHESTAVLVMFRKEGEVTTICQALFPRKRIMTHHIKERFVTPSMYHPACIFESFGQFPWRRRYPSLNRHGSNPIPVTQNNAFNICESISIPVISNKKGFGLVQIRRGEYKSLHDGWHIAGAALTSNRNNIPPHATILSMYTVIKNP